VLGLSGLEQVRDDRMAQVVEPEAAQAGRVSQRPPGTVPLFRRLGRVAVVVLARGPAIMLRVRVREFVRALEHPGEGVAGRAVQRDSPFARLVLAVTDVEHALARRALDVPHLL
jgi:hypothetical protein